MTWTLVKLMTSMTWTENRGERRGTALAHSQPKATCACHRLPGYINPLGGDMRQCSRTPLGESRTHLVFQQCQTQILRMAVPKTCDIRS